MISIAMKWLGLRAGSAGASAAELALTLLTSWRAKFTPFFSHGCWGARSYGVEKGNVSAQKTPNVSAKAGRLLSCLVKRR
jgi:hypothetical protein